MFNNIFTTNQDTKPLASDETLIDGIKHCIICTLPRQCRIQFQEKTYLMPVKCRCQQDLYDTQAAVIKRMAKERKINQLKRGLISSSYHNMQFDKSEGELKFAQKYVDNWHKYYFDNVGLILMGGAGTGKTFAAGCIANALINKGISVMMANVLHLTDKIGNLYDKDRTTFIQSLQQYELLIIDDFGAERTSDFVAEQIYNIIETRYSARKPLIITSNIPPEQLKNCTDMRYQRTYDRIKEICIPVILDGESRRKAIGNELFARLKEELSL